MAHRTPTVIDEDKRFSQSLIWQLQRNFFSQQGVGAWSKGIVPHYVTSNPYMAQAYAGMIFGWLRDIANKLDTSQPVYIIELGAGSGRLAYHFLQTFFDFFDASSLRDIPITYVLTEFADTTINFWKTHEQLQPWVESGRLDFAKFDATQDTSLTLIHQGTQLSPSTSNNPMAFIANYFFDSLPQDMFRVGKGDLFEQRVTLTVPKADPDLNDPNLLKRVDISYDPKPITSDYYADPKLNILLERYTSTLSRSNFLLPIGGFECIQRLLKLTDGQLLLVSADKGYHREEDLFALDDFRLSIHGSISLMVNYHAIGAYTELMSGEFLGVPYQHSTLDICALVFGDDSHQETAHAYYQEVVRRNPDDFYVLNDIFDETRTRFDVRQFLSYLRLCNWDNQIFWSYVPTLLENIGAIPFEVADELHHAMMNVWQMYYHIGEKNDLPFAMGSLLSGLEFYAEAIEFFKHSLRLYEDHSLTLCNLAICYDNLNQPETALDFVKRALALDSEFELAQDLQLELEAKLKRRLQ